MKKVNDSNNLSIGFRNYSKRLVSVFLALGTAFIGSSQVTVNIVESGSDVVATFSGKLDLTGLSYGGPRTSGPIINPSTGEFVLGSNGSFDVYSGASNYGPLGSGGLSSFASVSNPISFGANPSSGEIWVPMSYTSGVSISGGSTWLSTDFTTLGLTAGTYVSNWGADSVTIHVGAAAVPESSSLAAILALAALGFALSRRRCRVAT